MPPCLSRGPREAGGTGAQAWGAVGNTAKSTFVHMLSGVCQEPASKTHWVCKGGHTRLKGGCEGPSRVPGTNASSGVQSD